MPHAPGADTGGQRAARVAAGTYAEAERTAAVMGEDFWSYGLAGNEAGLRTFLRYSREQGLASRMLEPAELFAPETTEGYVI